MQTLVIWLAFAWLWCRTGAVQESALADLHERTVSDLLEWSRSKLVVEDAAQRADGHVSQAVNRCPLWNVDIFVVTQKQDFPMMDFMMASIAIFMPCYGRLHLVGDDQDLDAISTRASRFVAHDRPPVLHSLQSRLPTALEHLNGYYIQQWIMFWADEIVKHGDGSSELVMFLDTDSILAMPITCASLFDDQSRIYHVSWSTVRQANYVPPCSVALGVTCNRSTMASLPFTMPIDAFAPLREHMRLQINLSYGSVAGSITTFDEAFAMVPRAQPHVVMGEYMRHFRSHQIHQVYCPHIELELQQKPHQQYRFADQETRLCRDFVLPGVHLGWASCWYVGACPFPGFYWESQEVRRVQDFEGRSFRRVLRRQKYGDRYVQAVRQIIIGGLRYSLRWQLQSALQIPSASWPWELVALGTVRRAQRLKPHYATSVYMHATSERSLAPNLTAVYAMYRPDRLVHGGQSHCKHLRQADQR